MKQLFDSIGTFYDLIYKEKEYANEAKFVVNLLKDYGLKDSYILEFGSGTGKHATELVKNGLFVDGIERSSTLFSLIKKIKGFNCQLGDIRSFKLKRKYAGIISLFHVMSYQVSDEDIDAVFKNASNNMKKGGLFLFDFWYSPAVLFQKPEVRVKRFINQELSVTRIAEPKVHIDKNRVDVNYTFFVENLKDGTIEKLQETHPIRHFNLFELEQFASLNGMKVIKHGEWLTNNLPSEKSWNVYILLKKS